MSERTTVELIRELARDIAPVRLIPRLWIVTVAVLAVWIVGLGAELLLSGRGARLRGDSAWSDPSYLAALIGLALAALGASAGALAAVVPGRHETARRCTSVAVIGLFIAVGAGLWGLASHGAGSGAEDLHAYARCIGRALMLGLAPTLLIFTFIGNVAVRRPDMGATLALAGGIALGAFAVHATCGSGGSLHQLVAHTLVPLAAAGLLGIPLGALFGRLVRNRIHRTA